MLPQQFLTHKVNFFAIATKVPNICATFERKFVQMPLSKVTQSQWSKVDLEIKNHLQQQSQCDEIWRNF